MFLYIIQIYSNEKKMNYIYIYKKNNNNIRNIYTINIIYKLFPHSKYII